MAVRLTRASRVLIVGGSGFIGSHVAPALDAAGIDFAIADLRAPDFTHADARPIDYFRLDVRDEDALVNAMRGCDAVVNLAAAHHDFGVSERTFQSVNVGGARALTAAMRRAGIVNLCFYSSVAVYGEHEGAPIPDERTPPAPTNPYGASKWEAEQVYREWFEAAREADSARLLVLRPAVVFGPRNYANVYRMIRAIDKRRFLPVGAGTNVKSMASVENLVAALLQLWSAPNRIVEGYEVYNYCDTPDLTSAEVIRIVYRALGRRAPMYHVPAEPALTLAAPLDALARMSGYDLPVTRERIRKLAYARTQFSSQRVHAYVTPVKSLPQALEDMVRWYSRVRNAPIPAPAIPPERFAPSSDYDPEADTRRVVAVLVTYNREQLLQASLDALAAQTRRVDDIVIVDNASTDRSAQVADTHPVGARVLHLQRNVGGAGGFTAGMAHALAHCDPDFLWIMDDDTVPEPRALEELLAAHHRLDVHASILSSTAVWTNGEVHPMNSSRTRLGTSRTELEHYEAVGARPIRTASFVSALIDANDAWHHGLPWADYFIWSDDFEYTARVLKDSHGFNIDASRVEHRTATFSNAQTNPGQRLFFDVRNKIWALTSGSFRGGEALLYAGSTALGWARLAVHTKGEILPVAWTGIKAGIFQSPRSSDDVLYADPEVADEVRRVRRLSQQSHAAGIARS